MKTVSTLTKKRPASRKYVLTDIDKRFLEAVDMIRHKNSEQGIKPSSDKGISRIISNDTSTIAKIRRSQRGVTLEQIRLLSNEFNLDINFFFRPEYSLLMQEGIGEMLRVIQQQLAQLEKQNKELQENITRNKYLKS